MKQLLIALVLLACLPGCSIIPLGKDKAREQRIYLIDSSTEVVRAGQRGCLVVVVNPPEPAPGFGGALMLYSREANRLEQFSYSRWAAAPARMLEPLILRTLRETEAFEAVLPAPAAIVADLRVEADDVRLLQVFDGAKRSEIVLQLEARAYAPKERQLLASKQFSYNVPAAPNPAGGVQASQQAVRSLLVDLSEFVLAAAVALPSGCEGD